ncbi:hypothetical protein F5Y07DRAFT_274528 [Xylaria sp. FL0933]|nr:hypothetical protein F5Y07DRAFT_274528 [Xylaria sp. FL0933]
MIIISAILFIHLFISFLHSSTCLYITPPPPPPAKLSFREEGRKKKSVHTRTDVGTIHPKIVIHHPFSFDSFSTSFFPFAPNHEEVRIR